MKRNLILLVALATLASSCSTLGALGLKPSNLETVTALKSILNSSTFRALQTLKSLNDGGVASLLPAELQPVLSTMKTMGYGDEVETVTKQIGNISSIVLDESQGVMTDAIKEVKFSDAVSIVLGGEDAATEVLRNAMYGAVKQRYAARMENELQGTEALQYWPIATGAYNMFSSNKIEGNLSDFMAERAVDAVFLAMGKEEKEIRSNYEVLGDAVVTKVFDYYKNNKK